MVMDFTASNRGFLPGVMYKPKRENFLQNNGSTFFFVGRLRLWSETIIELIKQLNADL